MLQVPFYDITVLVPRNSTFYLETIYGKGCLIEQRNKCAEGQGEMFKEERHVCDWPLYSGSIRYPFSIRAPYITSAPLVIPSEAWIEKQENWAAEQVAAGLALEEEAAWAAAQEAEAAQKLAELEVAKTHLSFKKDAGQQQREADITAHSSLAEGAGEQQHEPNANLFKHDPCLHDLTQNVPYMSCKWEVCVRNRAERLQGAHLGAYSLSSSEQVYLEAAAEMTRKYKIKVTFHVHGPSYGFAHGMAAIHPYHEKHLLMQSSNDAFEWASLAADAVCSGAISGNYSSILKVVENPEEYTTELEESGNIFMTMDVGYDDCPGAICLT